MFQEHIFHKRVIIEQSSYPRVRTNELLKGVATDLDIELKETYSLILGSTLVNRKASWLFLQRARNSVRSWNG